MRARPFFCAAILTASATAIAQDATFTVKDGRALILGGGTELGAGLFPTTADASTIVDGFSKVCLPDPASADSRVAASGLGLSAQSLVLPAQGGTGPATIKIWAGSNAAILVWQGDEQNFKGRPIAMPSRAAITTGPYGPFKAFGNQCNFVTKVTDFTAAKAVIEAISSKYGVPGKLVVKNTFADGYWQIGTVRLNINVPTTRSGPQPLHISAQVLPEKGKK